jgi:RNA polymerase sigma-70 factor (ECF subfamily)
MMEFLLLSLAFSASSDLDDRALAASIRSGDAQAFRIFYERHYDPLYRYLVSRGADGAQAEDLIQKAFLMIWEKRESIDPTKSLRSYLFTIGFSKFLNERKRDAKSTLVEGDDWPPVEGQSPEDAIRYRELLSTVHAAVEAMPEKRRMVFELCFLKQYSYQEAADALSLSRNTIENHMAAALKEVRARVGGGVGS